MRKNLLIALLSVGAFTIAGCTSYRKTTSIDPTSSSQTTSEPTPTTTSSDPTTSSGTSRTDTSSDPTTTSSEPTPTTTSSEPTPTTTSSGPTPTSSEETTSSVTTRVEPTKDTKTITYLASVESEAYTRALTKIIDDFNQIAIPQGFMIKTETPGGDYYQSLKLKISSGKCPDIFMMEYGSFNASFQKSMLDLSSYLDSSEVLHRSDLWDLNDYYKTDKGELKAIIKDFSPDFMLIYNKTMLNRYNQNHPDKQYVISRDKPMSWEKFYEMTSAIQREYSKPGVSFYGTSLGFEGVKHLHEMVQSTGTNMYTNEDTNINKTDPKLREAFAFFLSMQKDNVTQHGADTASEIQKYGAIQALNDGKAPASFTAGSTTSEQEMFKQQRCFSIFNGLYAFPFYNFYDIKDFEWDVAPHPIFNATDSSSRFGTTSAMVSHAINAKLNTSSQKAKCDMCWKFLEYYETEGLKQLAKIAYNIPGNKTIAGSDYFLQQSNPKTQDMVNFFYNFVKDGCCTPTRYNSKIGYSALATCYNTAFTQYYDSGSTQTFDQILDYLDSKIHNQ